MKEGVPQEKIQGILGWAEAESPDCVLIIASNFLSNPCKEYIKDYERNKKPKFKIKHWENPDIERLSIGKSKLLLDYQISKEFEYLRLMKPSHLLYLKDLPMNNLNYLFRVLDNLDPAKRDEIMGLTYQLMIDPDMHIEDMDEKSRNEYVNYEKFKERCRIVSREMPHYLLSILIVIFSIGFIFKIGDKTNEDYVIQNHKEGIQYLEERKKITEKEGDTKTIKGLNDTIAFMKKSIKEMPERIKRNYKLYEYFCDNVIEELLKEELIFQTSDLEKIKSLEILLPK